MEEYILVTGSRTWTDFDLVEKELSKQNENAILIHGGAFGADSIANYVWVKKLNRKAISCKITQEEWKQYGNTLSLIHI